MSIFYWVGMLTQQIELSNLNYYKISQPIWDGWEGDREFCPFSCVLQKAKKKVKNFRISQQIVTRSEHLQWHNLHLLCTAYNFYLGPQG